MSNWWADKLNGQQPVTQTRPANIPTPPSQRPMTRYTPPQPSAPAETKAISAKQSNPCPECGGSNYMSPNPQTIAFRCVDCGYPVTQAGSRYGALTGARVEGNAKTATGNSQGGWNPTPAGYNADGSRQ